MEQGTFWLFQFCIFVKFLVRDVIRYFCIHDLDFFPFENYIFSDDVFSSLRFLLEQPIKNLGIDL